MGSVGARRFWQCPYGKDCKYRHALPPGYWLKSQMKELLEQEAANVGPFSSSCFLLPLAVGLDKNYSCRGASWSRWRRCN